MRLGLISGRTHINAADFKIVSSQGRKKEL